METDSEYFYRRAQEQREAAMAAQHPNARTSHLELALRYEDMARATSRVAR